MNNNIKEFLSKVKYKDLANLIEYVYINYIKNISSTNEIINNLIELYEWDLKSDNSIDISKESSKSDYADARQKASGILKPNIDNLIAADVEQKEFYERIWATISNPVLFANEIDIIGALIFLGTYDKIPYFKLDKPLHVTEDEFYELFEQLNMEIQKFIFIFSRGYEYRTDVASQLLRILEDQPNEKRKVVLLTNMLNYLEWCFTGDDDDSANKEKDFTITSTDE